MLPGAYPASRSFLSHAVIVPCLMLFKPMWPKWLSWPAAGCRCCHRSVSPDPYPWGEAVVTTTTETRLYGPAIARSWNRLHPRLTHRSSWVAQTGTLPVIEGTVIRLDVARLSSGAIPKPVWLWYSVVDLDADMVDVLWQPFLRRAEPPRPGPGRPPGHRNQHPAPRYDVHIKTPSNAKATKPAGPRPRRRA